MRNGPRDGTALARRDVLRFVLGAGAAGLFGIGGAAALDIGPGARSAELFAFRTPKRTALVFAVAFAADCYPYFMRARMPLVRIHVGSRSWTAGPESTTLGFAAREASERLFVGRVARLEAQGEAPYNLFGVSVPAASFPAGALAISADISGPGCPRTRIGNPIVAELMARDATLWGKLGQVEPERGRARSAEALADLIAAKSLASGHPDPGGRGKRIAEMLASDTLSFDPARPEGFTFAGQNGRRPFDATADVVGTLLAGAAAPCRAPRVSFLPSDEFPYFSPAVA